METGLCFLTWRITVSATSLGILLMTADGSNLEIDRNAVHLLCMAHSRNSRFSILCCSWISLFLSPPSIICLTQPYGILIPISCSLTSILTCVRGHCCPDIATASSLSLDSRSSDGFVFFFYFSLPKPDGMGRIRQKIERENGTLLTAAVVVCIKKVCIPPVCC